MGRDSALKRLWTLLFAATALFVIWFGVGLSSWMITVAGVGLLILVVVLMAIPVLRGESFEPATARVIKVSEPPVSPSRGFCSLDLVVEAPSLGSAHVRAFDARTPAAKWPAAGAILPVILTTHRPRRLVIAWDEAPLTEDIIAAGPGGWYKPSWPRRLGSWRRRRRILRIWALVSRRRRRDVNADEVRRVLGQVCNWLFAATALFVIWFGVGLSSWMITVAGVGLLILVVVLMAIPVLRGESFEPATARVIKVSEPPVSPSRGFCSLDLVVEAPSFGSAHVRAFDARTPAAKWPAAGAILPVILTTHRPRRLVIAWDEAPLTEDIIAAGPGGWYKPSWPRRIRTFWLMSTRQWRQINASELSETMRHLPTLLVLGVHRWYCEGMAQRLLETPEMLSLRAVTRLHWAKVIKEAVADRTSQESIFNETRAARSKAAASFSVAGAALAGASLIVLPIATPVLRMLVRAIDLLIAGADASNAVDAHLCWACAVQASGLPTVELYIILGCAVILAISVIHLTARKIRTCVKSVVEWRRQLTAVMDKRLRRVFQAAVNAPGVPELRLRTAPGLAGGDDDQLLERSEAARLHNLAFNLGAGAIAVSGPRGVGKSTMLAALTDDEKSATRSNALKIIVSAPVHYDPREFLLHLYAQLCKAVLQEAGAVPRGFILAWLKLRSRTIASAALRVLAAALILLPVMPVIQQRVFDRLISHPPATVLLVALTLLIASFWVRGPRGARRLNLAVEAEKRLQQTRFLQTLAVERHGMFGRAVAQFGWRRSRQLAEQPLSLPEIVDGYREFAANVVRQWRTLKRNGMLLVAIDEVDRITDPTLAERFLNEIKAIFGVPNCVYFVSISEEALSSFERRAVRMRSVFDSAFDQVVRLEPLTLEESVQLLRRRVTGVPDRFLVLCHCLAGGMPREVLRTAREMFDIHRASQKDGSTLEHIAQGLVKSEVDAIKRSFLAQITHASVDRSTQQIADLLVRQFHFVIHQQMTMPSRRR